MSFASSQLLAYLLGLGLLAIAFRLGRACKAHSQSRLMPMVSMAA
jgi:hypothetical protein